MPGSQRYNGDESESKDANASHSKDVKDDLIPKTFKITSKIIDRRYGISSRIKGHLRCGGTWKAKIHARSKEQVVSPQRKLYLRLHEPSCVLRSRGETHNDRDFLSSLAGLSVVAIGQPIPCFDPTISKFKTDNYKSLAKAFLNRNTIGPASSLKM